MKTYKNKEKIGAKIAKMLFLKKTNQADMILPGEIKQAWDYMKP